MRVDLESENITHLSLHSRCKKLCVIFRTVEGRGEGRVLSVHSFANMMVMMEVCKASVILADK